MGYVMRIKKFYRIIQNCFYRMKKDVFGSRIRKQRKSRKRKKRRRNVILSQMMTVPPPPDNITIQFSEIDPEPADTPSNPPDDMTLSSDEIPFTQIRGPFPKMMSQFRMITPCLKKTTPFPQSCSYPVLLVVTANRRIPFLQKTTPFLQTCSYPLIFMMAIHKIPSLQIPHSPRTTITSSSSFKLSPPYSTHA